MNTKQLNGLTIEELQQKKDSLKLFSCLFNGLIILLLLFNIQDSIANQENDRAAITISICTIGGFAPVYQELRQVKEEIKSRS